MTVYFMSLANDYLSASCLDASVYTQISVHVETNGRYVIERVTFRLNLCFVYACMYYLCEWSNFCTLALGDTLVNILFHQVKNISHQSSDLVPTEVMQR